MRGKLLITTLAGTMTTAQGAPVPQGLDLGLFGTLFGGGSEDPLTALLNFGNLLDGMLTSPGNGNWGLAIESPRGLDPLSGIASLLGSLTGGSGGRPASLESSLAGRPAQGSSGASGTGPGAGLAGGKASSTPTNSSNGNPSSSLNGLVSLLGGPGGPGLLSAFMDSLDAATFSGIVKAFSGPDLRSVQALFDVPDLSKYAAAYLDMRNTSAIPFIAPLPFGPAPQACKKHELIIARGTGELGAYGFIVGDPLLERVQRELPDTQGYAVQYPANVDADSWKIGAKDVVDRLNMHSKRCPDTKFALVGYSQGAMVMHMAVNETNPSFLRQHVVGGAMFGDPYLGTGKIFGMPSLYGGAASIPKFPDIFSVNVKNNCAVSWESVDPVCDAGDANGFNLIPHATYNNRGTKYMDETTAHLVKLFREHQG